MREISQGTLLEDIGTDSKKQELVEMLVVTAIIAFSAALGIVFSFAVLTGADIFSWEPAVAIGVYFLLGNLIWAALIIKNH